ncbi:MAG: TIGR02281 family clan AA aspartic protease [Pseudomonadota bacterium]
MSEGDLASFIFLLLFLAFIGVSYMASMRGRMGQSLQQMAIWCLIFFGFIAVYSMRDVILAEIKPTLENQTLQTQSGSYVFQRKEDGHFHVILDINDTPIQLVVDTGATGLVLNKQDARKIGLDLDELRFTQSAYTANGIVKSAPVTIPRIMIGQTEHFNVRASVNGGDLHSSLLGMSYINRFSEFRIVKDLLYLTP